MARARCPGAVLSFSLCEQTPREHRSSALVHERQVWQSLRIESPSSSLSRPGLTALTVTFILLMIPALGPQKFVDPALLFTSCLSFFITPSTSPYPYSSYSPQSPSKSPPQPPYPYTSPARPAVHGTCQSASSSHPFPTPSPLAAPARPSTQHISPTRD